MSKIVVISDAVSNTQMRSYFTKQIINHAAETANEVYFVTQDEGDFEDIHPKVQILRSFKKWNVIEAAKLLPVLLQIRAEIFHFIQPIKKIGVTHALPVLAAFAKSINAQNIFSLIEIEQTRGLDSMLRMSDLVSLIDPSQEVVLKKRFGSLEVEYLPARASQDVSIVETFVSDEGEFIFVPENLKDYDRTTIRILVAELKTSPKISLVCAGSLLDFDLTERRDILRQLDEVSSRVRWTGPLSRNKKLGYMKSAKFVLLAGLRFSPSLIHENVGLILAAQVPSVLTTQQVATSGLPLVHHTHAQVVEVSQVERAIQELVAADSSLQAFRHALGQLKVTHSEDDLGNRLSRIYTRVLV